MVSAARAAAGLSLVVALNGCGSRDRGVADAGPSDAAPIASASAAGSTDAPRGDERGEVLARTLDAPSLGVAKSYLVWLPAGYARGARRYPVVYLLHSLGGNEGNWVHHGNLRETADAMRLEAIVVMPDLDDGLGVNAREAPRYEACLAEKPPFSPAEAPGSYCVRSPRYEDYLAGDVVRAIDGAYRTIPDAGHRALIGAGMGGFAAWMLALRHPDLFGAAASHSGFVALSWAAKHPFVALPGVSPLATSFADERTPLPLWPAGAWGRDLSAPIRRHVRRVFGDDLADLRAHDPALLVEALTPERAPRLYLDAGTDDGFRVDDEARYVHGVLERLHLAHRFELTRGPHLFSLWKERLPKSLAFAVEAFAAADQGAPTRPAR